MRRRTALQLVALGTLAKTGMPATYTLRFFTPAEDAFLDQLTEAIIPADDHSPGAHAAQVSHFIDWMVSHGPQKQQQAWRAGLRQLHAQASRTSLAQALAEAARRPTAFFTMLKDATIDGYYTSEIGIHRELNYQGNEYILKFPGCTHPEHQASSK